MATSLTDARRMHNHALPNVPTVEGRPDIVPAYDMPKRDVFVYTEQDDNRFDEMYEARIKHSTVGSVPDFVSENID